MRQVSLSLHLHALSTDEQIKWAGSKHWVSAYRTVDLGVGEMVS